MSNSLIHQSEASTSQNGGNVADWERLISAGIGSLLLTRSVGRSLPGAIVGGALAYRALTGHCHVYSALGVSTRDETEPPPGQVSITRLVTVDAPAEKLFDFFVNSTDEFARLMSPVASVTNLGENRYSFCVDGPFGHYKFVNRLTDLDAPHRMEWESEEGDVVNWGEAAFNPTDRGTEVKVTLNFKVPGGKLAHDLSRLTGMAPKETLERALKQMKAKFETGEVPTVEGQPVGDGRGRLERKGATA